MAEKRFELPRKDWYDSEGRMYKDALIENFNAIEEKMKYISKNLTIKVEEPDWSEIHIPDTTDLSTADEDWILNLKSFVDLLNIKNFPLECSFNGKKCVKLTYYDNNYHLVTIKDVTLNVNEKDRMLVYLNTATRSLETSGTLNKNLILIGCYSNGNIYAVNDTLRMCDIDLLSILYKMPIETGDIKSVYRNQQYRGFSVNRTDHIAGWCQVNLHHVWNLPKQIRPVDIGREGGKTREVSNDEL